MITRSRIRQIISEAVGVPDDIDMMVEIFTAMVKDSIQKFKDSGEEFDIGSADVKNYGDTDFKHGEINISKEKIISCISF